MCDSWEYGKPMRTDIGTRSAENRTSAFRAVVSAVVAGVLAVGAVNPAIASAPSTAGPAGPVGSPAPVVAPVPVATPVPGPADLVGETGSWFAHGYTLDLRSDGTGTFAVWVGAFDGTRIDVSLIPAPGPATVAEVVGVETVGAGALGPDGTPGIGGLVTIAFGAPVRTAHVEWTSGPRRLSADLCPAEGLDAVAMAILRCGA